jgi:hypothetical protein
MEKIMATQPRIQVGYGLTQALENVFPIPIVAKRAPTTADTGYQIGQIWVYVAMNAPYILTSVLAGSATWLLLESGGGAGVFSSLTVNPGPTALSTVGNGNVTIGNSTNTGQVAIQAGTGNFIVGGNGNSILIGTDAHANTIQIGSTTTGTLTELVGGNGTGIGTSAVIIETAAAGDIQIGLATQTGAVRVGTSTTTGTVNIGNTGSGAITIGGAGTMAVNIGNTTGNTAVTGSLTASTSLTATAGNITATNGNIVLSTAATYISMPGPVFIYSGAGVPSNGLALHVGDMYINTTAASATTRLYIATAASTWTNVTCAG